ncbi:MAG: FkbM family methyltransferase [Akkermansiaceae bacterium]
MKSLVRKSRATIGYEVRKMSPWTEVGASGGHLAYALAASFSSLHGLRFLQVGANDGRREDPIADFIDNHEWRGVFVEAVPALAAELRRNRPGERFEVVNRVLGEVDGTATFYSLNGEGLPDWAQGLGTLSLERITDAGRDLASYRPVVHEQILPCQSMSSLLHEVGCEFDLAVIDVEGFDYKVLQWLAAESALPKVVHFEHKCLSPEERNASFVLLQEKSYNLLVNGCDCTAYRC